MNLRPAPFQKIKSGEKTIELRLFDEKRRRLAVGDTIVFTQVKSGETLSATFISLHNFNSFKSLYKTLPMHKCGYRVGDKASPDDMREYYSLEDEQKYGVLGIEIKVD